MSTRGDRAREARLSTGLSQPKLSKLIGFSASAISQLETNTTKNPKADLLLAIERATGYSAMWIATGRGAKLTRIGGSGDPHAEKLRTIYDAILSLPLDHQEKISQDVNFLLSLEAPKGDKQ